MMIRYQSVELAELLRRKLDGSDTGGVEEADDAAVTVVHFTAVPDSLET